MPLECTEWSQSDGDHFHGLCVNEFEPDSATGGCSICVSPVQAASLPCPMPWMLASSDELLLVPADLSIEFQTGDLEFRQSLTCNRTAEIGVVGKSYIPELVGLTVGLPVVRSDQSLRIWQTAWIPCGSRFASHKKTDFSTGNTVRYYRQDWDVEVRFTLQIGNGPTQPCFLNYFYEARRTNNRVSGAAWWYGLDGGIGYANEPCTGWQLAGYSWGIENGTIQNINAIHGMSSYYKVDSPAVPGSPYQTYLLQLNNDVNRAKPRFNWRFATIGCAGRALSAINSIEEEVVCENIGGGVEICRSFSSKAYPRYTQGLSADKAQCGVQTVFPTWTPGIITARIFEG